MTLTFAARIGDPTVAGWVIFSSYFAAAVLCARALRASWIGARMSVEYPGAERRARTRRNAYRASLVFWIMLVTLFVFLGINKQIDMQTWVTDFGRRIAMSQGWYEQRGRVQTLFVLLVAIGGLTTLTILLKLTRELLPRHVLAFFGLILLAYYMLVRASSFHDLDAAMRIEIMAVRVSWMIEMGGIICVGACAVMNSWWHKSLQPIDQPAGEPA